MPNERPLTPKEVEEIRHHDGIGLVTRAALALPRALETIRQQAARIAELERELAAARRLVEACDSTILHGEALRLRNMAQVGGPSRAVELRDDADRLENIARLAREAREGTT